MAQIEKRGNSYRIRASCGYTIHGKQVKPSFTWTPDPKMSERQIAKEVQRQAVLFEEKCNGSIQGGHVKLETFIDQYFEEYAPSNLRERTRASYAGMKERVNKSLGHLFVDKIAPRQIKKFAIQLESAGENHRTKGALSPKSIGNYIAFLSSVFSYAVSMEMIQDNPCRNVMPPRKSGDKKVYYTLEEAQVLLDTLKSAPTMWKAFFTAAMLCGYRREELCGLEWPDVDFTHQTISICRASLYTPDKGVYTDTTKNESSKRVGKQPAEVFDALRRWRAEQAELRIGMGDQWIGTLDRIFTGPSGNPIHPNSPYTWLERHCKKNNIRFLGVHSLRHLNAALQIRSGADPVTVAANLGHSQPTTTLNGYAYEFAEQRAKAMDSVANLLSKSKKAAAQK